MLTLLRVRRAARLRRRPELDGASRPLRRAVSWQPSFFRAIRDFTNHALNEVTLAVARDSNLQTTNLGVGGSNPSGRASLRDIPCESHGIHTAILPRMIAEPSESR